MPCRSCGPWPPLLGPAPQDIVDRGARHLQVTGDRLGAPAIQIQRHDRPAAGDGIADRVVAGEAPRRIKGQRLRGEYGPHGVVTDWTIEALLADRRDLAEPKGGVLGLEFDDGAPNLGRQLSPIRLSLISA